LIGRWDWSLIIPLFKSLPCAFRCCNCSSFHQLPSGQKERGVMSCWVVPTVAAELWGVSVDTILSRAQAGDVPSKTENGFMFVDVAPDSHRIGAPKSMRPPTYTVVTEVKPAALQLRSDVDDSEARPVTLEDWRTGRALAARSRKPPQFG
jgi:hypothetical protein